MIVLLIALISSVAAIASIFHINSLEYICLAVTIIGIYACYIAKREIRNLLIVCSGFILLSMTPLGTETDILHVIGMAIGLAASAVVPLMLYRRLYHKHVFSISKKQWDHIMRDRSLQGIILFAICASALTLGIYFLTSDAHKSWPMNNTYDFMVVGISIMCIGVWEEVFFIATMLKIYRSYAPFAVANLLQAIPFSIFLFAFGFQGWIIVLTVVYALYQGWVYTRYNNLLANIIVHLVVDFFVFCFIFASALFA